MWEQKKWYGIGGAGAAEQEGTKISKPKLRCKYWIPTSTPNRKVTSLLFSKLSIATTQST
jgi:hypothetical protein